MKIVIDIDDNLYTRLFDNGVDNYDDAVDMAKAIRKGTPLPKGHGRLIDASQLFTVTECRPDGTEFTYVPYTSIENAKAVIDADKEV